MPRYIGFRTKSGSTIIVEVEEVRELEPRGGSEALVEIPGEAVKSVEKTFEEVLQPLRAVAEAFVDTLSGLASPPDEIGVTFGLTVSGEAGIPVISKSKAEATFTVGIRWTR